MAEFNQHIIAAFRCQPEVARQMTKMGESFFFVCQWIMGLDNRLYISDLPAHLPHLGPKIRSALIRAIAQASVAARSPPAEILRRVAEQPVVAIESLTAVEPGTPAIQDTQLEPPQRDLLRYNAQGRLRRIRPPGNSGMIQPPAPLLTYQPPPNSPADWPRGIVPVCEVEECESEQWTCIKPDSLRWAHMRRHALTAHEPDVFKKAFARRCPVCQRGVNNDSQLEAHMKTHTPIELRHDWTFICDVSGCGYRTDHVGSWSSHKASHLTADQGSKEERFGVMLEELGVHLERQTTFRVQSADLEQPEPERTGVFSVVHVDFTVHGYTAKDGSKVYLPKPIDFVLEGDEAPHQQESAYPAAAESQRAFKIAQQTGRRTIFMRVQIEPYIWHDSKRQPVEMETKAAFTVDMVRSIIATECEAIAEGRYTPQVSLHYLYYDTFGPFRRLRVSLRDGFYEKAHECIETVYNDG